MNFEAFKNREVKAKDIFTLAEITKVEAYNFVKRYHYLKDAKFFAKYSVGLFFDSALVGVASFSNPQGIVALKSWFSLTNLDQSFLELSRLCMLPELNGSNATSYLLGNALKIIKKHGVKAVITLADDSRHSGAIYQVCNFKYFGLTDKKSDFYVADGRVNPRGTTKELKGVWLPRTQKHRYCYLLDSTLKVNYVEHAKPKADFNTYDCCGGNNFVFDNRFKDYYTCPKCTGEINLIDIL